MRNGEARPVDEKTKVMSAKKMEKKKNLNERHRNLWSEDKGRGC